MKKTILLVLPILFTAQACNFLFGGLYGDSGNGSRGIFLSSDSGDTWQAVNNVAPNTKALTGAQLSRIFVEQTDNNNLLAPVINIGVYASDNKADNWVLLLPNFVAYDVFINPSNSKEIYASGARGGYASVVKSSDRGGTWTQIYTDPNGKNIITAMQFDPRNPESIYAGLSDGVVIKSTDSGETWNKLTNFADRVSEIIISSDNSNLVYVMTRKNGLNKSIDGGKTWQAAAKPIDGLDRYNDVFLESGSGANLFLATIKGLYRSSDSGSTWTKLELPVTASGNDVSAVAVSPDNNQQIYASINSTIFKSTDRGQTWRTDALPTGRVINTLTIDPVEPNRIYAGLK